MRIQQFEKRQIDRLTRQGAVFMESAQDFADGEGVAEGTPVRENEVYGQSDDGGEESCSCGPASRAAYLDLVLYPVKLAAAQMEYGARRTHFFEGWQGVAINFIDSPATTV